jgi:hypothetical protein
MAELAHVLARLKREPMADLPMAGGINQLCAQCDLVWRERLLPPLVTLRLFLIQILHGNCAIAALRQLSGVGFAVSSYCESRGRLPLRLLELLLGWLAEQARRCVPEVRLIGHRVLIADGSTYSMPDTPQLNEHFHRARGTQPGVGYPMGKLMGLLDAATGLFVELLALPLLQHDMRSVVGLHPALRAGDILLGDRAFCSFAHFCLLQARGVLAAVRLHQRRKHQTPGVQRWIKPKQVPAWMDAAQYALLPALLDVRVVGYTITRKGYRTRRVLIATTLLDEALWPDAKIAELYGHRWSIETCFGHLKTTMKMNVLRCQSVAGVQKELAVYLAVYNLVRLAMLKAARVQHHGVWRISFVDALRWLAARLLGLPGVGRLIVNPDRTGRWQLRVIRRRIKPYDLLTRPRRETEAKMADKQAKSD